MSRGANKCRIVHSYNHHTSIACFEFLRNVKKTAAARRCLVRHYSSWSTAVWYAFELHYSMAICHSGLNCIKALH